MGIIVEKIFMHLWVVLLGFVFFDVLLGSAKGLVEFV